MRRKVISDISSTAARELSEPIMAEILFNGKRLEELKVVEIRDELAKRGLSRKGIKSTLIKRFEKELLKEREVQETNVEVHDSLPFEEEGSGTAIVSGTSDENQDVNVSQDFDEDNTESSFMSVEKGDQQQYSEGTTTEGEGTTEGSAPLEQLQGEEEHIASNLPFQDNENQEEEKMDDDLNVDVIQDSSTSSIDQHIPSTERLESVTSIIEPTFLKEDEELIYEGDVDNEDVDESNQVEMEVDNDGEEEKDELIVDFTAGELELDPRPIEDKNSASASSGNTTALSTGGDTTKNQQKDSTTGEMASAEERSNVWVSGLSQVVSASDLKTLFSPFGQVISAKVVARARSSKNQRYGFVTMGSPEQAEKSIQSLNKTELKGQMIVVELSRNSPFVSKQKKKDQSTASKRSPSKDKSDSNSKKNSISSKQSETKGSKNDSASKGSGSSSGSGSGDKSAGGGGAAANKRIISVEKNDGRKELYTASGKRRRDEQRGGDSRRNRSPRPRSRSPRPRSRSPRARSRSPRMRRNPSPRGRIVSHRLSPVRLRRGGSPPFRRAPSPPIRRRVPSPPRRVPSPPPGRRGGTDDVRRDLMRREMERREIERRDIRNRLGGRIAPAPAPAAPPAPPPSVREMEMRLEEQRQRLLNEREREREALRREMEMKTAHREQEIQRRLQEIQQREERERQLVDRQQREFMQLQRSMKERETHLEAKEREIKEKEIRERQRLEALERQKEKDLRDIEKRYREKVDRDLKEKEMLIQREQESMRVKLKEQERSLLDKERQIRAEQERLVREKEEMERKQRRKDEEKERDRKEREDSRRGSHFKDDDQDKERSSKRSSADESIFGRLGNRDGVQDGGGSMSGPSSRSGSGPSSRSGSNVGGGPPPRGGPSTTAIVKETQISPNVMYRRIESQSNSTKPGASNRSGVSNPYSQNQTRSKALESLSTNYATPRHSNNPVGYPQPARYSSGTGGYGSTAASNPSVGYGSGNNHNPPQTNNPAANFASQISNDKFSTLLSSPDFLNALTNVARNTTGGSQNVGTGGGMSGNFGPGGMGASSNTEGGRGFYRGGGGPGPGGGGGVQGRQGGSGGFSSGPPGMGGGGSMSQSQYAKHMNKGPSDYDHYSRRGGGPPRSTEPYAHFNKRM